MSIVGRIEMVPGEVIQRGAQLRFAKGGAPCGDVSGMRIGADREWESRYEGRLGARPRLMLAMILDQ